jgi:uncharacterized protein YjbJ (UPF0337 family)
MGLGDKIENAAQDAKGKAKEAAGDATDDKSLQSGAKVKKAAENVKDIFKG